MVLVYRGGESSLVVCILMHSYVEFEYYSIKASKKEEPGKKTTKKVEFLRELKSFF